MARLARLASLALIIAAILALFVLPGARAERHGAHMKAPKSRGARGQHKFETHYKEGSRGKGKVAFDAKLPVVHLDAVEGLLSVAPAGVRKWKAVFDDLKGLVWPTGEFLLAYFEAPDSIKESKDPNQFAWLIDKVETNTAKKEVTFFGENPKQGRDFGSINIELGLDITAPAAHLKRSLDEEGSLERRGVYDFGTTSKTLWSSGASQQLWSPSAGAGLYCENCGVWLTFHAKAYYSVTWYGSVKQLCGTVEQGSVTGSLIMSLKFPASYSGTWSKELLSIPITGVNVWIASLSVDAFLDAAASLSTTSALTVRAGVTRVVHFSGAMGIGCPSLPAPGADSTTVVKPTVTLNGPFTAGFHLLPGVRIRASLLSKSIAAYAKVDLQAIIDGQASKTSMVSGCSNPAPAGKVALSGEVDFVYGTSGSYTSTKSITLVPKTLIAQCCGSLTSGSLVLKC